MAMRTGTHDISSLLATRNTSAAEFGLDNINEVLQADLRVHNDLVEGLISAFMEITADRQRLYGSSDAGEMVEADEYGAAPTQKPSVGSTVGFPLRLFQYAVGWTRKWFESKTPADMAIMQQGAQKAHLKKIQAEIKRAIFLSANYTWRDMLLDNIDIAVKRFLNADSTGIPEGPNGEVYDGATHSHYIGSATLTAAAVTSTVNTVVEHGHTQVIAAIAAADRVAFEALTGFKAYPDPRVAFMNTDQNRQTIVLGRLDNLAIGTFGNAEVWVKPWAIANYVAVLAIGGAAKPLVMRTRTGSLAGDKGLQIAAEFDKYPLHARFQEAEFGAGVWTRTAGAVLYFANATFADPVIVG